MNRYFTFMYYKTFLLLSLSFSNATAQGSFIGEVKEGKYSNKYFGFEFEFPAYWSVQDNEMKKKLMQQGSELVAGNDEQLLNNLTAAQINVVNLLTIFEHPVGTPIEFNPNAICMVERVDQAPEIKSGKDYLEMSKSLLEQSGYIFPKPIYSEIVGGKSIDILFGQVSYNGINVYQKYCAVKLKNFILLFIFSYNSDEDKNKVDKIFRSINFNLNQTTTTQVNTNKINTNTNDNTPPQIIITYPSVSRGFTVEESGKEILVKGKATDESGIYEIDINGTEANLQANGEFSATVLLAIGENKIIVKAIDTRKNKAEYNFTVNRTDKTGQVVKNNSTTDLDIDVAELAKNGKYYALLIGVQDYTDESVTDLNGPIPDADKLKNILNSSYHFDSENITFLKNPQRSDMVDALDNLAKKITGNDNLLIFYAGHGYWDEKLKQGFWLPADSKKGSRANWFSNSSLRDYLGGIETKHTLLIADACFSGGIFKTRNAFGDAPLGIKRLYELPSRKAMTSGAMSEVPDKSVFIEFLVKRLKDNAEKYLSAEQLFTLLRPAVLNNSANGQIPQYGEIREVGDEGGDFIFIKKD